MEEAVPTLRMQFSDIVHVLQIQDLPYVPRQYSDHDQSYFNYMVSMRQKPYQYLNLLVVFVIPIQQNSLQIDMKHAHRCEISHSSEPRLDF